MPVSPVVEARANVAEFPVVVDTKSEPMVDDAAERAVVDAFTIVAVPPVYVLVNVAPVAERLVVDALLMVAVPPV